MGHLTSRLVEHIRTWDHSSQIALAVSGILMIFMLLISTLGSDDLRQPALIGLVGLILMTQVIVMWGNRDMVTPFTKAQRHYMAGEYDEACAILQSMYENDQADLQTLTLLGNTFRQLRKLQESENLLREALEQSPEHHFPLYGMGRTLIVQGRYDEAVSVLRRALDGGAPLVIQFDLFEALYRHGDERGLRTLIPEIRDMAAESYRRLMFQYIMFQLDGAPIVDTDLLHDGLPHWVASAKLYRATPYGTLLQVEVQTMQQLLSDAR